MELSGRLGHNHAAAGVQGGAGGGDRRAGRQPRDAGASGGIGEAGAVRAEKPAVPADGQQGRGVRTAGGSPDHFWIPNNNSTVA